MQSRPEDRLPQPKHAPHRPAQIVKAIHAPCVAADLVQVKSQAPVTQFIAKARLMNEKHAGEHGRDEDSEQLQPMRGCSIVDFNHGK